MAQSTLPQKTEWSTGKALDQQLTMSLSVTWSDGTLKNRIASLAHQQKIAIFIDRRIDPSTPVNLSMRNVTFEKFLWTLASQHDWGICRLDNFYYLGPSQTAAVLPIAWNDLAEETRKRKRAFRIDWNQRFKFEVPDISIPGQILSELANQHQFEIESDVLPHDLWSATSLPPLRLDQQVAMLCVGFGKWFKRSPDGKKIKLTDFPDIATGKINFGPFENGKAMIQELRKNYPDCRISTRGKSFSATGSPHQLATIQAFLVNAQQPIPVADNDQRRFTLSTRSARGNILATIAQQTNRMLEFDPALREVLNEHVEITVKEVTLTELVEKTLAGTGASFSLDNERLIINQH